MVCLSEVFGLDAVLVFLEDFIVAFLLTAGDATMTEFFVCLLYTSDAADE